MSSPYFAGKRALVVDDQDAFLEAVTFELDLLGIRSITAVSGRLGFEAFKANPDIDLIISDIRMPDWDGGRFLTEVRKISAHKPPFILMSGFSDLRPEDAFAAGCNAFIGKPVHPSDFAAVLANLLAPLEARWTLTPDADADHVIAETLEPIATEKRISLGTAGLFVDADLLPNFFSVERNNSIQLMLTFKGGELSVLNGTAKVAWVRGIEHEGMPPGVGLEWTYLEPASRAAYVRWIREHPQLVPIPKGPRMA